MLAHKQTIPLSRSYSRYIEPHVTTFQPASMVQLQKLWNDSRFVTQLLREKEIKFPQSAVLLFARNSRLVHTKPRFQNDLHFRSFFHAFSFLLAFILFIYLRWESYLVVYAYFKLTWHKGVVSFAQLHSIFFCLAFGYMYSPWFCIFGPSVQKFFGSMV